MELVLHMYIKHILIFRSQIWAKKSPLYMAKYINWSVLLKNVKDKKARKEREIGAN